MKRLIEYELERSWSQTATVGIQMRFQQSASWFIIRSEAPGDADGYEVRQCERLSGQNLSIKVVEDQ
jgi:hypothetical protein